LDHEIPNALFLAPLAAIDYVYGPERTARLARLAAFRPEQPIVAPQAIADHPDVCRQTEVIFTTWGMPHLSQAALDESFPRLRAVFYAAGSVQYFARPLLARDITVVSAWRANGVAVAEFTVAQVLLAMKGYFRNVRAYDGSPETYRDAHRGRGVYGETIGLLGVGAIGRHVIELLRPFEVTILVWDPFLADETARELGVRKAAHLHEVFESAYVVSNHLADKPETAELLGGSLFESMRRDATFINTGRGRTVNEAEFARVLRARPDLTALLDGTFPEPTGTASDLIALPNVHISTHIAGTIGDEVRRLADLCIEEFERYLTGQPLRHQVTEELLEVMA